MQNEELTTYTISYDNGWGNDFINVKIPSSVSESTIEDVISNNMEFWNNSFEENEDIDHDTEMVEKFIFALSKENIKCIESNPSEEEFYSFEIPIM